MTSYPTIADVMAIHEEVMSWFGLGPNPIRDENALDSAISRTRMAEFYEDADLLRQAALLAVGISQAQAFLDGNKRSALAATDAFLRRNGIDLRSVCSSLEFARELERVAERPGERTAATEDFEGWLRERLAPVSPSS